MPGAGHESWHVGHSQRCPLGPAEQQPASELRASPRRPAPPSTLRLPEGGGDCATLSFLTWKVGVGAGTQPRLSSAAGVSSAWRRQEILALEGAGKREPGDSPKGHADEPRPGVSVLGRAGLQKLFP